jgi:hypothetical protein
MDSSGRVSRRIGQVILAARGHTIAQGVLGLVGLALGLGSLPDLLRGADPPILLWVDQ